MAAHLAPSGHSRLNGGGYRLPPTCHHHDPAGQHSTHPAYHLNMPPTIIGYKFPWQQNLGPGHKQRQVNLMSFNLSQLARSNGLPLLHVTCHYHEWPAITTRGLPLPYMACHYREWPAITTRGLPLPYMACHYREWPAITTRGLPLPRVACHYHMWPVITTRGLTLPYMACHYYM